MDRILTCILNNAAGGQNVAEAENLIARIAAEQGWQARIHVPGHGADLAALSAQARADGDLIAAGGGDGTISAVAATLVDSGVVLGVLPMGTLNHFAKDLNIPLDLEAAVRTLFTGSIAKVDVGEVNGRIFLNNSSIGLYPQIVRKREQQQRRGRGKWMAFVEATAHVLRRAATLHLELDNDRETTLFRNTPFLFVGNNRYETKGLEIGKRTALDRATLWVCVAPQADRGKLFRLASAALLGSVHSTDLITFNTRETVVRTRPRHLNVATDGEVSVMRTPLHYRIRPGALRVVVPATA